MLNFTQAKNQNFYTATAPNNTTLLKSYNTIVAIYDNNTSELIRARYSKTTGKQISKWANNTGKDIYVTQEKLAEIIEEKTGLKVNTIY